MNKQPARIVFSLTTFFLSICYSLPALGQEIVFQFNPPESVTFNQNLRATKTTDMGSSGSRTDVTDSKTQIAIQKVQDGYTVTATTISARMYRDGQEIANPILSLLQDIVVTYEVDQNGNITSVRGYDRLAEIMKESLPPQVVEQLTPILNEETLVNKDIMEWNGRITNFVGSTVEIGDVFVGTEQIELPMGGAATYYSVTEIAKTSKCNDHDCVDIAFHYNSNPDELAKSLGDIISNIYDALEISEDDFKPSNISIVGSGRRTVDPNTMLTYSEKIERTMEMDLDIPGQGKVPTKQIEIRESTFEY
ncbi:MAG: hypothetical protein ACXABY_15675 [Candidatus Thorarchaeota archaeon]|jgi:hypothetical protein